MTDPAPPPPPTITLKEAYIFFLPLIFMAEMMMISHSVIHATLARLPDPKLTLAAYNVAFSFHSVAGSPIWTAIMTALAFIGGRDSVARLFWFHLRISLLILVVGYLMALTPLGDLLFGRMMGAGPSVVADAKRSLLIFMWIPPVTIFRSLSYALLMRHRHTMLITIGTLLRLIALAGYLLVLPLFLSGASVGAAALLLCILTETVLAVALSYRFYLELPEDAGPLPSNGELWRFAWPLMLTQASENGVAITINFFLGRLARPELALAAFGVADGLWKVLLGALRNLAQTAQTLVRNASDRRVVMIFAVQVALGFAVLGAALMLTPVREFLLGTVMGLTPELNAAVAPALFVFWLLAFVLGFSALFRGLLLNQRVTGQIARSAVARLAVVVSVGALALFLPGVNGALLGLAALLGGFGAEALVLGRRVFAREGA